MTLLGETEEALAEVLRLCPVTKKDFDAVELHDEGTIALLSVNEDAASVALGTWLKCIGKWSRESHIDDKLWPAITRPVGIILQDGKHIFSDDSGSSGSGGDPTCPAELQAHCALVVVLFRCMLLGQVGNDTSLPSSSRRIPSPAAWTAVRAYLSLLAVPGAASYGVSHPAILGLTLTNLRSWWRSSSVYSAGRGGDREWRAVNGACAKDDASKERSLRAKRSRNTYKEEERWGEDEEEEEKVEVEGGLSDGDNLSQGVRKRGRGGRSAGRVTGACETPDPAEASVELLQKVLASVSVASHQGLVGKLCDVLLSAMIVGATEGRARLRGHASEALVTLAVSNPGAGGNAATLLQCLIPVILMSASSPGVPPRNKDCIRAHEEAINVVKALARVLQPRPTPSIGEAPRARAGVDSENGPGTVINKDHGNDGNDVNNKGHREGAAGQGEEEGQGKAPQGEGRGQRRGSTATDSNETRDDRQG
ncbi:unnamed protein product, partial [Discosporangium mesarthrocarpum]